MNRAAILRADLLLTPVAPARIGIIRTAEFHKHPGSEAGHERGDNIITNVVINNADSQVGAMGIAKLY